MAAKKKPKVLGTFTHPMTVRILDAKFVPHDSVALLDLARLSKGSHRVEIGHVEGGSCQNSVTAVVKNGMVVDLEFHGCEGNGEPAGSEMMAVMESARKKLKMATPAPWKPMPVGSFFESPAAMTKAIIVWGGGCILVCIEWGGTNHCLFCCAWPPHCFIPTIYTGPLD